MSQIKLWMLCWVVSGKKTVVHFWFDGTMDVIHDPSKMFFYFLIKYMYSSDVLLPYLLS
jgi:hypothetical protein